MVNSSEKSPKKKRYVTRKQYKEMMALINHILKNQKNIIETLRTTTAFNPTSLRNIDGETENVKRPIKGTNYSETVTKKRRSAKSRDKLSVTDIKALFHNKGFTVQDDGKKPIKILNERGKKVYVVQRKDGSIWKRDKNSDRGYVKVSIEELMA